MSAMLRSNFGSSGSNTKRNAPAGYDLTQLSTLSPEQQQLWSSIHQQVQPSLASGLDLYGKLAQGDESAFSQLEAPAYAAFEKGLGTIGSRFSGMGMGSQKGSGFKNALTGEASNLAQSLQGQRLSLQQNAIKELFGMSKDLLSTNMFENVLMPEEESGWKKWVGASLPIIGAGTGAFFGGLPGAKAGGSIGAAASKAFF